MPNSIFDQEIKRARAEARRQETRQVQVGQSVVTIPTTFPSPDDWRDQWIYFLLVDRFNNPCQPPNTQPWDGSIGTFQGGNFNGIRAQLDYLQNLGVGAIWLSPVMKNCLYNPYTYHGYGIQNFLEIDPRFASDPEAARADPAIAEEELRALVDEAHARGIYVIFDIVLNHAGDVFAYDGFGSSAPWSDTPYKIFWRDADGTARPDWTSVPADAGPDASISPRELRDNRYFRRRGVGDETAGDFASLKEFVTEYELFDPVYGSYFPVREILIKCYEYVIARYDVDGFRIDTLKYIEPEFALDFANSVREFAYTLGKKEFFTFGEVYDSEDKIDRYIGRNASEDTDLIGVDAALDFPLFYRLPGVMKGMLPPSDVMNMFEYRHEAQRGLISSHGEASKFFVTFLDNHDQHQRFYYCDPADPHRYDGQLSMGLACLFGLQGIPCLYYGTEQGLHGSGSELEGVREALWGKPDAFDPQHPFYQVTQQLAALRLALPALRYGRQYFRPISGNGVDFGVSFFTQGVLAFSRLLSDQEVVVIANTSPTSPWNGSVLIDFESNADVAVFNLLFTNQDSASASLPGPLTEKIEGTINVVELEGRVTHGPTRIFSVYLRPMEVQILSNLH